MKDIENFGLIGHSQILGYLKNCLNKDLLSHAYVLFGREGVGRMTLLREFVPTMVKSKSLIHPDVQIIVPNGGNISIDTIRGLRAWLHQSPIACECKVAIIDHAEAMNIESQNAFLKILEEPSRGNFIFLTAGSPKQLLPTICSRSVRLHFNPISRDILKKYFSRYGLNESDYSLSAGAPGVLINNISNKDRLKLRSEISNLSRLNYSQRLQAWAIVLKRYSISKDLVKEIIILLKDALVDKVNNNSDSTSLAKSLREAIGALIFSSGQNWRLISENLILSI